MTTWAVMKDGEVMIAGRMVKKRVPVFTPDGKPLVLHPGIVFNSEAQAKEVLQCSSEVLAKGINDGALQWRTPQGAKKLLETPGYGNNSPIVEFGDVKKSTAGETYKNEELDNLSVSMGPNLSYSPEFLSKQTTDWKRAELAKQRPNKDVEVMDDSMLTQVLSENYKG